MKKSEDTDFWQEQASLLTLLRIRKLIKSIPENNGAPIRSSLNHSRDARHEDYKQVFKHLEIRKGTK